MTSNLETIARIADGLTEPMRETLLHGTFDDDEGGRILWFDTNAHTAYALNRRRLADEFFHLTPLGIAVRDHIATAKL